MWIFLKNNLILKKSEDKPCTQNEKKPITPIFLNTKKLGRGGHFALFWGRENREVSILTQAEWFHTDRLTRWTNLCSLFLCKQWACMLFGRHFPLTSHCHSVNMGWEVRGKCLQNSIHTHCLHKKRLQRFVHLASLSVWNHSIIKRP